MNAMFDSPASLLGETAFYNPLDFNSVSGRRFERCNSLSADKCKSRPEGCLFEFYEAPKVQLSKAE